jgi:hypothetical protein
MIKQEFTPSKILNYITNNNDVKMQEFAKNINNLNLEIGQLKFLLLSSIESMKYNYSIHFLEYNNLDELFDDKKFEPTEIGIEITDKLQECFSQKEYPGLRLVEPVRVTNKPEVITALCEQFSSEAFEGIVLRHPFVHYNNIRSDYLLKYKLFSETDLTIVACIPGERQMAGKLAAFVCEGEINGEKVSTAVGTGFSMEQRELFLKMFDQIRGTKAEIKYKELTDCSSKGRRSLVAPAFIKLKQELF